MQPLVLAHDLGVSIPTVPTIVTLSFPLVSMAAMCLFPYCVGHLPHVLTCVCTMCLYISHAAWGLIPQAICLTFIQTILALSWNAHFYLLFTIFCILRKQVMIPSSHVMARKYSHVMMCHISDCVVLVDQARDESHG